ncbi:HORMA domain-containing protein [Rhizophagus diaphanus]|nr:HORMA domain-containing protein [Rhizophagus diaphanus] [Rhizophagus sp. MUCL 43196]
MSFETKNIRENISLKGSTKIVVEFFEFALNSILFQRAIYPPEDFKMVKKYGLNVLVTIDDSLKSYLKKLLTQVEVWINAGKISKLILAIMNVETREILERWQFDIQIIDEENKENKGSGGGKKQRTDQEIKNEIQAIIRQITASVTFLPVLEDECTFNILAFTDKDAEVPAEWDDSDPLIIQNPEYVRLRSFSTKNHKVDAIVSYRLGFYDDPKR